MTERIENDRFPDIVENDKGSRRLELLGMKEKLSEPKSRRAFFAELGDSEYVRLLGYINSVVQKQPIRFEYGDSSPAHLVTPPPAAKSQLMEQTFKTVRSILSNNTADDRVAIRRAALTMAGAINYIHPYDNGNGRAGRVAHYLIEFGSERGDRLFNDELYAIIGKTQVYEFDRRKAIYDTPPDALTRALDRIGEESYRTEWGALDPRDKASVRVQEFLKMMEGSLVVPVSETVTRWYYDGTDATGRKTVMPAGTVTGDELYEREYIGLSFVAAYAPNTIPPDAQRVTAESQGDTTLLVLDRI